MQPDDFFVILELTSLIQGAKLEAEVSLSLQSSSGHCSYIDMVFQMCFVSRELLSFNWR
jgi:hypothetical protein